MGKKSKPRIIKPMVLNPEDGKFTGATDFFKLAPTLATGQLIRAFNYSATAPDEKQYVIGRLGKLFPAYSNQDKEVSPSKALSMETSPDGWCFEGRDINALPESELKQLTEEGL